MAFFQEFKQFALKGNVVDLAVGIIIGGAFGNLVNAVVGDLITPLITLFGGKQDFSSLYVPLAGQDWHLALADAKAKGAVFAYGAFLTVTIEFTIMAFAVFLLVKGINMARHAFHADEAAKAAAAPPPPPPEPTAEEKLLAEIRDLLAAKAGLAGPTGSAAPKPGI